MSQFPVIGIIGAGTMGSGIAQVAATAGHNVLIFDNNFEVANNSIQIIKKSLNKFVEKNKLSKLESEKIIGRIVLVKSLKEFSNSELIIEAIIENENIKQKLYSELEKIISPNCVIATNTSSFSIQKLSEQLIKRDRFIGMHFFNPPVLMELVEIIFSSETDSVLPKKIKSLLINWKKVPVIVKDTPGFIVNRIARSFYLEALKILEEKITNIQTIDWAMREFGKFKMGPFELMDLIGLDINYSVSQSVYKSFQNNPRFKPSELQKKMVSENQLGRKTGIGFYNYSNGNIQIEPTKDEKIGKEIFYRIISMLINEAAFSLEENIASYEDIELAMQKGANYPKRLFDWGNEIGYQNIIAILNKLEFEKTDKRYSACSLLLELDKNKIKIK